MPRLTDLADVRVRLERDRAWAAFSLADLDPPLAAHARWFGLPDDPAVVLVYGAYDPPIVICHGDASTCVSLLCEPEVRDITSRAYLNATPAQATLVGAAFRAFDARPMVRMLLKADAERPGEAQHVRRLEWTDLGALQALYEEEPPAFFMPSQLREGAYFGVFEGSDLVAVAGTHVVSRPARVAALGNVYTRRDRRCRGFAGDATRAVTGDLRARGIETIVLNIVASNEAARRVYERAGFVECAVYVEGVAHR